MTVKEAEAQARRRFGNTLLVREQSRDQWGWRWLEELAHDIRFSLRLTRREPAFTAVVVLTLALGIGANTAIFSIVNAVFLRPLPFPDSNRIYIVGRADNWFGGNGVSLPIYIGWRQRAEQLFDGFGLLQFRGDETLTRSSGGFGGGTPERIRVAGASPEMFSLLAVNPLMGRSFNAAEGRAGGPNVVVLTESFWRTRFGADPAILGRTVNLNQVPHTVIGVLPASFELPMPYLRNAQIWEPVQVPLTSNNPSNGGLLCVGKLKPGVSPAQADAALTPTLAELRQRFPKMFAPHEKAQLIPLQHFLADWAGSAPWVLFAAVGLVLLIGCVNVANLTLSRSAIRQKEIAIRTAIGAGRARIVRQLVTESILLALLGGAAGVVACYISFSWMLAQVPANLPHVGKISIDLSVIGFAVALSVVTGLLFGLAPAIGASRLDLNAVVQEGNPRAGSSGGRMRRVLAAGEVAMSALLLVGALLAIESFARLLNVQPGFDGRNTLTFAISLPEKKYDNAARQWTFFNDALARIRALPGVEDAALSSTPPLAGGPDTLFSYEGGSSHPALTTDANIRLVSPDFFHTLRIPLKHGRLVTDADGPSVPPVLLVNEAMAKMFFPGQDPVGQRIWIGKPMGPANAEPSPREIVGIVGDVHEDSLSQPAWPTMYEPYAQARSADSAVFLVRSRAGLPSLPSIQAVIEGLDPYLALADIRTMDQITSSSVDSWRFRATLLGIFGGVALFLAAVGIYGVLSYSVAQRTREIGTRAALGAKQQDILRLVLREGGVVIAAGLSSGLAGAVALTRVMANFLFGLTPTDPVTFITVAAFLTVVALIACNVTATRAARVDPVIALRAL